MKAIITIYFDEDYHLPLREQKEALDAITDQICAGATTGIVYMDIKGIETSNDDVTALWNLKLKK